MPEFLKCPICNTDSQPIYSLKRDWIIKQLHHYYNELPPAKIVSNDYDILRCKNCTLEYANPLQAGNDSFYQWITTRPGYYPKSRWEWFGVLEEIQKRNINKKSISILDIGCGRGDLIEIAQNNYGIHIVGLDTTSESVNQCRQKGFEVYCNTIESFKKSSINCNKEFDYVLSFHCLEHVSDPKSLVKSMLSLIKKQGSVFISTPYSPMSFESDWFDILNNPPHHLLRWNKKSYEELAHQLGCKIQFHMPPASSVIARTTNTFRLSQFGKNQAVYRFELLQALLKNPVLFFRIFLHQLMRYRVNRRIAADVVLVELKLV